MRHKFKSGEENIAKRPDVRKKISKAMKGKASHFKGKTYAEIYGINCRIQAEKRGLAKRAYHDKNGRTFKRPMHVSWCYTNFVKKVFERDDFKCVICGKKGGRLNADHYPKTFAQIVRENNIKNMDEAMKCSELWDIKGGRTTCEKCHKKTPTYGYNQRYKQDV
jgi:5-methylcytosine-specific restriction endonuclease McrA